MTHERPVQIIHSRAADALIQRLVLHLQRRSLHQLLHQRLRDHGADSAGGVPGGCGRVIQVVCVDLLELLAVAQVSPVHKGPTVATTKQGLEVGDVGLDASRFPVSIPIFAVGHVMKGDASHEFTGLQQPCLGILNEPHLGLKVRNDLQRPADQLVGRLQIARRSAVGDGVLTAIRRGPDDIEVRLPRVVPVKDAHQNVRRGSGINIKSYSLKQLRHLTTKPRQRSRAAEELKHTILHSYGKRQYSLASAVFSSCSSRPAPSRMRLSIRAGVTCRGYPRTRRRRSGARIRDARTRWGYRSHVPCTQSSGNQTKV